MFATRRLITEVRRVKRQRGVLRVVLGGTLIGLAYLFATGLLLQVARTDFDPDGCIDLDRTVAVQPPPLQSTDPRRPNLRMRDPHVLEDHRRAAERLRLRWEIGACASGSDDNASFSEHAVSDLS